MTLLLMKRASSRLPGRIINTPASRSFSTRSISESITTIQAGSTSRTTARSCAHRPSPWSSTTPPISSLSRPLTPARYFSLTRWRSSSPPQPSPDKPQPPSKTSPLKKVASALSTPHENIYTIPNLLTVTRLIAAPFIGYCIVNNHHTLALSLFTYAGISDLLDGWIARKWNLKTVVGTIIDPLADKTLMTVLTVALATQGSLPVWLAVIILGRDVGLAIAAVYYRWISLPPPKTMSRYWDFSLPSAEVRPTTISKYNTALQLGLMGGMMVAPVVPVDMGLEFNMEHAGKVQPLMEVDAVKSIAAKHGKTPSQVLLRWATQRGLAIIPKSTREEYMVSNLESVAFDLTEDEIKQISALDINTRFNQPANYFPTEYLWIFG